MLQMTHSLLICAHMQIAEFAYQQIEILNNILLFELSVTNVDEFKHTYTFTYEHIHMYMYVSAVLYLIVVNAAMFTTVR